MAAWRGDEQVLFGTCVGLLMAALGRLYVRSRGKPLSLWRQSLDAAILCVVASSVLELNYAAIDSAVGINVAHVVGRVAMSYGSFFTLLYLHLLRHPTRPSPRLVRGLFAVATGISLLLVAVWAACGLMHTPLWTPTTSSLPIRLTMGLYQVFYGFGTGTAVWTLARITVPRRRTTAWHRAHIPGLVLIAAGCAIVTVGCARRAYTALSAASPAATWDQVAHTNMYAAAMFAGGILLVTYPVRGSGSDG